MRTTFASVPTQGQGKDKGPNPNSSVLSPEALSPQAFWVAAPKHFGTNFGKQAGAIHGMVRGERHFRGDTHATQGQKLISFLATT